jgi:microcystin-dependent protein
MLLCDGSTFAKVDYPELYDVLPAVLIIDADNGSVPNLREAFVRGASTTIVEHSTGGEKQHTLSVAEMPIHSHSYLLTAAGAGALPGAGIGNIPGVTGFSGSSASHNNIPPYYALKYVVVAR